MRFSQLLRKIALIGAYLFALILCLGGSLIAFLLLIIPASRGRERLGRALVRGISSPFIHYMHAAGVLRVDFPALRALRNARGTVIVANHPSLIDAIILFSELPQTFCLVKGEVLRNPLIGPLARLAGYVGNESAAGVVQDCVVRLRRGENLVIFPEGTRTVAPPLNPLQPGFALIARRARAKIQTLAIHRDRLFLGKSGPFFRLDVTLPVGYAFTVGEQFDPTQFRGAREISETVESSLRAVLTR